MDIPSIDFPSVRKRLRKIWNSERVESLRFHAGYFRWPLLLVLLAVTGEKLIYYGLLPLGGYVEREIAYAEAAHDYAMGENSAALVSIRRALLETRDNPRLWILAAKISDRTDSVEAAYCWRQADRLQPGSLEIELALAEASLRQGQLDLADAALRGVSPTERETARYQRDAGKVALAEGQRERAASYFEPLEVSRPDDAETLFALAAWHEAAGNGADFRRAHELLVGLASRPDSRAEALGGLVELDLKCGDLREARMMSDRLLALPEARPADRVRRLDIEERSNGADSRIAALLETEVTDAAPVLKWMAAHGRAEQALIWIRHQSEESQDDAVLGLARAACLMALGDWEHLRDDQRDSRWPGREPERLMLLARACRAMKNEDDARAAWNEAVEACREPEDYLAILRAADEPHAFPSWDDEKAQVWMALAGRYPDEEWPLRSLLAYQLERGDLLQAQAVYTRLAALEPGDPALGANRDLLALLRRSDTGPAFTDLRRLQEQAPGIPTVATAAAYALFLQGKDNEALATMGALSSEDLQAPERAAYLGQLLAVAGPVDRAEACLKVALTQHHLLPEELTGVDRGLELVSYRRAMADLLHAPDAGARERSAGLFSWRAASGTDVFVIGQSVALALSGDVSGAAKILAQVSPAALDPAALSIYDGAVLELSGSADAAAPYLELSTDLPSESGAAKLHRALDGWWNLHRQTRLEISCADGLFATYRGLEKQEDDAGFWRRDAAREVELARTCLLAGHAGDAVEDRLESLLRHIPSTPQIEAQIGYALFLEGRLAAARARLEILAPSDLDQPEPASYYATILQACGEAKRAEPYFRRAASVHPPAEVALQRDGP